MVTYSTSNMLGVNVAQTYPTSSDLYPYQNPDAPFAVGQVATGTDGSVWVFVLAGEEISQYDAVAIDEDFLVLQLTSTEAALGQKFGVASQTAIAKDAYGWVQVRGVTTVFTLGGTANNTRLVSSATAGALDDTTTVGTIIKGIVTTTSNTLTTKAAVAAFMTVEPFCDIPAIA
jgi:hypothetical protein